MTNNGLIGYPGLATNQQGVTRVATSAWQAVTLSSVPVRGSESLYINGTRITDYVLVGSTLTLTTRNILTGNAVTAQWVSAGSQTAQGSFTFTTTPGSPVLRGGSTVSYSGTSATLALPGGSVAGDLAVFFHQNGFQPTAPAGWLTAWNDGADAGCMFYTPALTSTEITAGQIVSGVSGGSFNGSGGLAVFVGGTAGIRESFRSGNGGFTSSVQSTTLPAEVSDYALFWGVQRVNGQQQFVNRGTLIGHSESGASCGALYGEDLTASGIVTATFTSGGAGSGGDRAITVVKGA